MKFCCINSASAEIEVAAVGNKHAYLCDNRFVQASRALLPMLEQVTEEAELKLKDVDFISVVVGPGSFTGIRIGLAAARALAYALSKPIVAVNSCELAAYNSMRRAEDGSYESVLAALDAGNGYCYAAVYGESVDEIYFPPACMSFEQLKSFKAEIDEPCVIAADCKLAPLLNSQPVSGDGIIELSLKRFIARGGLPYGSIEPLYIRKSQAEEQLK